MDTYPGKQQHPNNCDKHLEPSERENQQKSGKVVNHGDMFSGSSSEYLPFEFRALEVALEAACTFLDTQVCGMVVFQKDCNVVL